MIQHFWHVHRIPKRWPSRWWSTELWYCGVSVFWINPEQNSCYWLLPLLADEHNCPVRRNNKKRLITLQGQHYFQRDLRWNPDILVVQQFSHWFSQISSWWWWPSQLFPGTLTIWQILVHTMEWRRPTIRERMWQLRIISNWPNSMRSRGVNRWLLWRIRRLTCLQQMFSIWVQRIQELQLEINVKLNIGN